MKSFILFLILSSSAISGLKTYLASLESINVYVFIGENILIGFLALEVVAKIIKLGVKNFFASSLNSFDLIVTLLSFFYSAFIIFRLLSLLPGLNKITQMIIKSLPSIAYVSLLLAIHTYFYAIVGVGIFSKTDSQHFGSLVLALISLFQVITLEGWADLMNFEMQSFPIASPLYFISFVIFGTILILNVLVSVMTNAFVESKIETEVSSLKQENRENFNLISNQIKAISKENRIKPNLALVVNNK